MLQPPDITCFLFFFLSLTDTGTVEVKVSDSAVKVVKEQDVFIPCTISGYGSTELDLQLLSVHWSRGSDPVYIYDRGSPNPIRTGSELLNTHLIRGNAGLYIPQAQIRDEGEYTCAVTLNTETSMGQCRVEVSVKPSARLVPSDVIIEEGTERGVTCHANNYYPEMIKFQWIKHLNDAQHVVLRQGVSTNEPLENGDGTFNVTSQLMLKPSMEDDGEKYSCIISHRSLENDLVLDFTLSVKAKLKIILLGAVSGSVAAVMIVMCICCCRNIV
ncbi:natural cytotoxicity triggering receptor 3 ligand 1-like isoform X2 [Xenopus laevis]|uniref:Natural cytotoxicity triggering receptor 3 ligand 1-like isoform X2 n=1 Tax=Xenopus laevis TaxID=8355 RepID=A0A8J1MUR0_XENLA|nr:natural cytotoxicity triggering receptor 3 ligand 1-like isoform X2 [Xenopus laevis]